MTKDRKNWKKAWDYFVSIGEIPANHAKNEFCLHHKDESLRTLDRARYDEWRIEDLEVQLKSEHTSHHQKGKTKSVEHKTKISQTLTGHEVPEETRLKISETQKGRPRPEISEKLKKYYETHHPWNYGTAKPKLQKPSKGFAVKGTRWWNNGERNVRSVDSPGEDFILGRIKIKHNK